MYDRKAVTVGTKSVMVGTRKQMVLEKIRLVDVGYLQDMMIGRD